ncbi:MAG: response regulator [Nitrospinaceae bacterium]|nr:response regulator [Nitrospinaceae bacterium]NIR56609.1 response regulator [Nitrospinaceae bacterium]NIS87070.1 response regulator [Nitrospinaceae bacterium]NIT83924.1 response regulator [Nitrospinaceae bacterium]NIU46117.1 response regulator [Nitrospinaceae bacterium]
MSINYKGKKVLVIDNSRWIARLIKNQLVSVGFEEDLISIATDGHQAFLILDLKEFDLVTSGLYLKARNGLDLLTRLRHDKRDWMNKIPFLVISAERSEEFINRIAKLSGANGYLAKPFLNEELSKILDKMMGQGNEFARVEQQYDPNSQLFDPSQNGLDIHPDLVSGFVESMVEAFGQYLVTAVPGTPHPGNGAKGEIVSSIEFVDEEHGVRVLLVIYFPRKTACYIYETIFGELDLEQVGGVVQELSNIIGGMAKIKVAESAHEIIKLVNGGHPVDPREDIEMHFKLGLPEIWQGTCEAVETKGHPDITVPFDVEGENAYLQVYIRHT